MCEERRSRNAIVCRRLRSRDLSSGHKLAATPRHLALLARVGVVRRINRQSIFIIGSGREAAIRRNGPESRE